MELKINGNSEEFSRKITVSELLDLKKIELSGTVVLLNDEVVKRENWNTAVIENDSSVELLNFVSGG